MSRYKLLIFDWDGTIMDSVAHIVSCLQAAIIETGAEARSQPEMRDVIGLGLTEAVLGLYPNASTDFVERFSSAFRHHFLNSGETPSSLYQNAETVLSRLSGQGYDMAIATGKSRRGLDKVLQETGLGNFFPVSYCADETFSKPHPQMLEEIITDYNVEVTDAIMIGDTEYDMAMAGNAGMHALAVTWGVHSLERLLQHRPTGYVDSFQQIPEWLEQNE